jgi:DNA-directed RNA polymerase specialized sigma24 family protein
MPRTAPSAAALLVLADVEVTPTQLARFVRAACDRDYEAAEVVHRELAPRMLEQMRKALGTSRHDAEDVLEELWMEMLEGALSPPASRDPVEWLLRIARERARDRRRDVVSEWSLRFDGADPDDQADDDDDDEDG